MPSKLLSFVGFLVLNIDTAGSGDVPRIQASVTIIILVCMFIVYCRDSAFWQ